MSTLTDGASRGCSAGLRHRLGGYHEHHPIAALGRFAESLWTHVADPGQPAGMHRVLPDPALNLALRCRRDPTGRPLDPRLVIIGPATRPFVFSFMPGDEIAAVRIKLEWARPLLGLDPAEHLDRQDDVADANPRLALELTAALAGSVPASRTAKGRMELLATAMLERARRRAVESPGAAAYALDIVRAETGRVRVQAIAGRTSVSLRQLRRAVRREAVFSLKAYARIIRLNCAMASADRSPARAWARIAAEAGFCDQSHLVRECRALTGMSPEPVARERRAEDGGPAMP
ncbi:MAG: helix-turn-helix domain-containing protein [Gemmatimonadales bacterium]